MLSKLSNNDYKSISLTLPRALLEAYKVPPGSILTASRADLRAISVLFKRAGLTYWAEVVFSVLHLRGYVVERPCKWSERIARTTSYSNNLLTFTQGPEVIGDGVLKLPSLSTWEGRLSLLGQDNSKTISLAFPFLLDCFDDNMADILPPDLFVSVCSELYPESLPFTDSSLRSFDSRITNIKHLVHLDPLKV